MKAIICIVMLVLMPFMAFAQEYVLTLKSSRDTIRCDVLGTANGYLYYQTPVASMVVVPVSSVKSLYLGRSDLAPRLLGGQDIPLSPDFYCCQHQIELFLSLLPTPACFCYLLRLFFYFYHHSDILRDRTSVPHARMVTLHANLGASLQRIWWPFKIRYQYGIILDEVRIDSALIPYFKQENRLT